MELRFRPDLKPGNKRFLLGALKNQAKSKKPSPLIPAFVYQQRIHCNGVGIATCNVTGIAASLL